VITDLVIVRDRRDFRRQPAIQRMLHGSSSARRFRRLIVVPSDHLCHHHWRCRRAFTSALLLLVLLENGPFGRPAKQRFASEIRGIVRARVIRESQRKNAMFQIATTIMETFESITSSVYVCVHIHRLRTSYLKTSFLSVSMKIRKFPANCSLHSTVLEQNLDPFREKVPGYRLNKRHEIQDLPGLGER